MSETESRRQQAAKGVHGISAERDRSDRILPQKANIAPKALDNTLADLAARREEKRVEDTR